MRFCSIVGQASIQTARASGPSTMERSSGLLPPLGIQAPWPRPGGGDIEPNEAEQDGGMPLVQHRPKAMRSEEHTSELQSRLHLVCRLLLEKKKLPGNSEPRDLHLDDTRRV